MWKTIKEILFTISMRFEETNAFIAIRQGLIMMIPLIVLGSLSLMIKSLPIPSYQAVLPGLMDGKLVEFLDFIYAGTFEIFSVVLSITTSIGYAMVKNAKRKSGRAAVNDCFILAVITLISFMGYMGIQNPDFSKNALGTTNTFMALVIALGSGWLYFKVKTWKIWDRFHISKTDMDGMYYVAVHSIVPAFIVVNIFALGNQIFKMVFHVDNIQQALLGMMEHILSLCYSSFAAGLVLLLSIHILWFFGIHGSNVLDALIKKNYVMVDGVQIYSKTFQDVFVIMGGCGAVLSLVIALLLFSRKKIMKDVAKLAFPGVVFNISEVIIFGLPIISNPVFFVPFLMVPVMNYLLSYGAMYVGLVPKIISQVEWTAPMILSGYQATGSLAGSVLQIVCLVMDIFLYYPFIRLFEKQRDTVLKKKVDKLIDFLQNEEEINSATSLTGRDDALGNVARMMASDLEEAVKKQELYLLYQPQVDREEHCIGAEALLRWDHPIVGLVYPPLIIRLAKEMGILHKMEEYIFDKAASALSIIEKERDEEFKISVNITNESLMWDGFEKMVDDSVRRYGVSREHLWMEITEQDALSSSVDISEKLNNLKEKGHKFLIDDFGMGHTSLLYLQTNNFEIVKIDGTITKDVMENERYSDILKSIIYLGVLLDFITVAEFVETREQMERLKALGIDSFQGYYYSRPIPLKNLLEWMKEH